MHVVSLISILLLWNAPEKVKRRKNIHVHEKWRRYFSHHGENYVKETAGGFIELTRWKVSVLWSGWRMGGFGLKLWWPAFKSQLVPRSFLRRDWEDHFLRNTHDFLLNHYQNQKPNFSFSMLTMFWTKLICMPNRTPLLKHNTVSRFWKRIYTWVISTTCNLNLSSFHMCTSLVYPQGYRKRPTSLNVCYTCMLSITQMRVQW